MIFSFAAMIISDYHFITFLEICYYIIIEDNHNFSPLRQCTHSFKIKYKCPDKYKPMTR